MVWKYRFDSYGKISFLGGGLQAAATHQSQQPIQLLQQIVTPNGEIQHMPVSYLLTYKTIVYR